MSDDKQHSPLPPEAAITIHVSVPLEVHISPQGGLRMTCYQGVGGQTTPIAMILEFDPVTSGQLVWALNHLIQTGAIKLETPASGSGLQ
jgi:hypothetical protein